MGPGDLSWRMAGSVLFIWPKCWQKPYQGVVGMEFPCLDFSPLSLSSSQVRETQGDGVLGQRMLISEDCRPVLHWGCHQHSEDS